MRGSSLTRYNVAVNESFNEQTIQAALTTRWLGRVFHYYPSLASTNDAIKQMVAKGTSWYPSAGTLLITDYQSQGKGRLNRHWQAPAGTSLLFSLCFRPHWPPEQANWLTMMAALAAAEAIEAVAGLSVSLKWPNDLLLGNAPDWRKAGGILLEGEIRQGRLESAILGIGLNVNLTADQLPAGATPPTSLSLESGRPISRLALLATLLAQLEAHYELAKQGQSPQPAWNGRLVTIGRRVVVTAAGSPGQPLEGIAEATDKWGHLLLRDDSGVLRVIAAGDVTLQRPGG